MAATRYLVGGGKEGGSHRRDGKGQGVRCGDPPRGILSLAPTEPLCDAGGLTAFPYFFFRVLLGAAGMVSPPNAYSRNSN